MGVLENVINCMNQGDTAVLCKHGEIFMSMVAVIMPKKETTLCVQLKYKPVSIHTVYGDNLYIFCLCYLFTKG